MKTTVKVTIGEQWVEGVFDPARASWERLVVTSSWGTTYSTCEPTLDAAVARLLRLVRGQEV